MSYRAHVVILAVLTALRSCRLLNAFCPQIYQTLFFLPNFKSTIFYKSLKVVPDKVLLIIFLFPALACGYV
jgi:hypothetical protein